MKESLTLTGKWFFSIRDTVTGIERNVSYLNLIPTVGKTAFASQIAGMTSTDIGDNLYVALGSNTNTPLASDTQLGTEVTRKASSSTTFSGAVGYVSTFFAAGEATGTHREFGLFGNGNSTTASITANTGIMFSHVSANITVSGTETLTTTFQLTFA